MQKLARKFGKKLTRAFSSGAPTGISFDLTPEQKEIRDLAQKATAEFIIPNVSNWTKKKKGGLSFFCLSKSN